MFRQFHPANASSEVVDRPEPSRRRLFRLAAAGGTAAALGVASPFASAAVAALTAPDSDTGPDTDATPLPLDAKRRLRLVNAHTWEKLDIVYYIRGMYIDESLAEIAHLMRDHRENLEKSIDPSLLDHLFLLHETLGSKERLHVLSGYRTPATNARLRKRSTGVAKNSLHMEGRAVDLYVPGVDTKALKRAALSLRAGGVGYYRKSGFVHMDTGDVRLWTG